MSSMAGESVSRAEFMQLRAALAAAEEKADRANRILNRLLDEGGLADTLSGTGQQQFFGAKGQIGPTGIQILADDNNLNPPGFWWLARFLRADEVIRVLAVPFPQIDYFSGIIGNADDTDNYVSLRSHNYLGRQTDWFAHITAYADASNALCQIVAQKDGGTTGMAALTAFANAGPAIFEMSQAMLMLEGYAADPTLNLAGNDGLMIYRTDLDVARLYANSAWVSLATETFAVAVTLAADADVLLSLTGQELGFDTQTANLIFAGPASGAAADPTFRALVSADLPASVVETSDADYIDLTDGGATTLHSHASGAMRVHTSQDFDNFDAKTVATDFWGTPAISSWNVLGTPTDMAAAYTSDPFSKTDFADYPAIDLNSNGDGIYCNSTPGFGTWAHARMVEGILGSLPTKLVYEQDAKWVTHTANETTSGLGFVVGGGSPLTAANHVAFIYSNGTNFLLRSSGASDTGAADDGDWHKFKIVLDSAAVTAEWFIDGVTQGTIALLQDTFPVIVGASVFTTNRIRVGWAHLYYE